MIIDFHCHVGKTEGGKTLLSYEELKKELDRWEIDKAVVFPFNADDLIQESLEILEKSKTEKWIIPFLRFDPRTIKKEELENLLEKGFKGIKIHPSAQRSRIDNPDFFWIYETIEKKGLPILFHTSTASQNYSHPMFLLNLAKQFPNLKIIMAHFLASNFYLLKEFVNCKNVYIDLSINSGARKRNQVFRKYGLKNLLFASDTPFDSMGVSLLKIREANLNQEELDLVFYKNALKVLNMEKEEFTNH